MQGTPSHQAPQGTASNWARAIEPSGYDPNRFYVAAKDARGHGVRQSLMVPPPVAREITKLVESGAFPAYEINADFIRDAIMHHLKTRGSQVSDRRLREANLAFFVLRDVEEALTKAERLSTLWQDKLDQAGKVFARLAKDGAWSQLLHHLGELEHAAEPAEEPYRSKVFSFVDDWRGRVPADHQR